MNPPKETPRITSSPNKDLEGHYQEKIKHQGPRKPYISLVNAIAY